MMKEMLESVGKIIKKPLAQMTKAERGKYDVARNTSTKLVAKANIKERCNEILDSFVKDKVLNRELARVAIQNKQLTPKVVALKEFNRVRELLNDKHRDENILRDLTDDEIDKLTSVALEELARTTATRLVAKVNIKGY